MAGSGINIRSKFDDTKQEESVTNSVFWETEFTCVY